MRAVWFALALGLAVQVGGTKPVAAEAGRPVVVELFTSQGCSSCPPADALLSELARDRSDVLPLAFHVDYWDNLGWRDPYSFGAATSRQRHYATALGLDSIYTPQMVVDGRTDVVGSDRAHVLTAIRRAADVPAVAAITVARDGSDVVIQVGAGVGSGTVWLIGYDPQHRTFVGRGENSGRNLLESNIVRSLDHVGHWSGGELTLRVPVPAGERIAAIVQADNGRILGAARGEAVSG
jgi:hypothetical protein